MVNISRITGDYAAAESTFRRFVVHYPDDYLPAFFLASVLDDLGKREEAITRFSQVCARWPKEYAPVVHLAHLYLTQGRFDAVPPLAARVRQLDQPEWAVWLEALSAFARGDTNGALAAAAPLGNSPAEFWRSRSHVVRGCWLAESGRVQDGIAELRNGIEYDVSQGLAEAAADKHLQLAQLYIHAKAFRMAREECDAATSVGRDPWRKARAGMLLAQAGYLDEARGILRGLGHPDMPRITAARHRLLGEIALAEGAARTALREFQQAAALPPERDSWEPVARALEALQDRGGALKTYHRIINSRAAFWPGPQTDVPDLQAECRRRHDKLTSNTNSEKRKGKL